jgi:hypothetical protein
MAVIKLNRGFVEIDDIYYEWLNSYTWTAWTPTGRTVTYAVSGMNQGRGANVVTMHRLIMGAESGEQVDHIDGNGLHNKRSNLRLVTSAQQAMNKPVQQNKMYSQFKGVTWHHRNKKWKAQIMKDGKNYHLGYFDVEEDAALAYELKAQELFKEFQRR